MLPLPTRADGQPGLGLCRRYDTTNADVGYGVPVVAVVGGCAQETSVGRQGWRGASGHLQHKQHRRQVHQPMAHDQRRQPANAQVDDLQHYC